ncbi:MAG: class II fructose-bisphosphate aldolase [Oceanospirillaceae bacterium]|nr:class II fructose-bisphosphate aldolase [Oceanospirillaceae bacterium]
MLVNLTDLMQPALKNGYAVPCFNVFGYEDALAVVNAAQARNAGVILAVNLDMTLFMPLDHIIGMLKPLAQSASVPVCLHLDHNYDIPTVIKAINAGFTSVMYDGSQLPIAENVAGVKQIVAHAKSKGVSVEAEVGSVPYATGRDHIKSELTDVREALMMLEQAKPDVLAVSVGNVHRLENTFVDIDFVRFNELQAALDVPLVIHGTSGVKTHDIQILAKGNVCKFNIGTCLRQRFGNTLRKTLNDNPHLFDRLTIMKTIVPQVSDEADKMIRLLGQ